MFWRQKETRVKVLRAGLEPMNSYVGSSHVSPQIPFRLD
jgi:hypothetical protein